jgi:uncharacterized protein (DUF2236 family)
MLPRTTQDGPVGLRQRVGESLFNRVAGPDGVANHARIHGGAGERRFAAGSPVQRVHGDASMFIGGLRALLLQALHPAVMTAVARHSDFREDPWGRLARTSTFLAEMAFAADTDVEAAVDRVRFVHERIRGRTSDGQPYRADDPHLLLWVHVAGTDSFLRAHQLFGQRPFDPAGADEYVRQAAVVGEALGAHRVPTTVAELDAVIESFRPELAAGPDAHETVAFLLRHPPMPWTLRPAYALLSRAAVATLPDWAVAELGLPVPGPLRRRVVLAGGTLVTRVVRWVLGPDDASRVAPRSAAPAARG